MNAAIFLDRDGVLLQNRTDYIRSWNEANIVPGALEALALASRSRYKFAIVTNQSGVGRGLIPMESAESINRRLVVEVHRRGGRIDAVFMCPHAPDEVCDCRKPKPGLLLHAARVLNIDLKRSIMIGDALSDVEAGLEAGVGKVALVLTGRGASHATQAASNGTPMYEDLAEALNELI